MKYRKTLTMLSLLGVSVMSLGSSCQSMSGSVSRATGGMILGQSAGSITGDSRIDGYGRAAIQAGQALTLNRDDERAIGESVALKLTNSPGVVSDQALNDYVTLVGLAVASSAGRPDIDFTFAVLRDPKVNAYAAPDGYVFVTEGALRRMRDESELAGVLGHEISHVVRSHGLSTIRDRGLLKAARTGTETAVQAEGGGALVPILGDITEEFVNMQYSQSQEREADLDAVKFTRNAGYDPTGLGRFIERELHASAGFFSSHPSSDDRVAALQRAAGATPGGQRLADRFAKNVKP